MGCITEFGTNELYYSKNAVTWLTKSKAKQVRSFQQKCVQLHSNAKNIHDVEIIVIENFGQAVLQLRQVHAVMNEFGKDHRASEPYGAHCHCVTVDAVRHFEIKERPPG